jgi:hypothetical protein
METKKQLMVIAVTIMTLTLPLTLNAQQRVIEESLVYDDPTVAKPGKWLFGASVDYYNYTAQGQAYDSNNNKYPSSQNFSQPGASAWAGYGDFSLLMAYKQGSGSTNVPAANTGWKTDNKN